MSICTHTTHAPAVLSKHGRLFDLPMQLDSLICRLQWALNNISFCCVKIPDIKTTHPNFEKKQPILVKKTHVFYSDKMGGTIFARSPAWPVALLQAKLGIPTWSTLTEYATWVIEEHDDTVAKMPDYRFRLIWYWICTTHLHLQISIAYNWHRLFSASYDQWWRFLHQDPFLWFPLGGISNKNQYPRLSKGWSMRIGPNGGKLKSPLSILERFRHLSSLASALPCPEATAKSRQWNLVGVSNPSEKYDRRIRNLPQFRGENKKSLKPPPRNTFSIDRIGLDGRCLLTTPTEIDTDVELVTTCALVINGHAAFVFLTRIKGNGISSDVLEDAFAIANIVWIKFHLHAVDRSCRRCRRDHPVDRGDGNRRGDELTTGIVGR